MERLNLKDDPKKYLQQGFLTMSFLPEDFVKSKVMIDYNKKTEKGIKTTIIESLLRWIDINVKYSTEKEIQKAKFSRTAKEIWESGKTSGCTDYALLFVTFARQLGIPATYFHTAEYGWFMSLKNNENLKKYSGHSFCECFVENRWILVDPTFKKIQYDYDTNKIKLDYLIGNSDTFIPYFRGLDGGVKQSIKEHNQYMDRKCLEINL